jgi:8-oxo-dGTP pyrophosphatase MutT (NUDIX family)
VSGPAERRFERIASEPIWAGHIVSLTRDRIRFADGEEVEREIVHHPGAVGIVAHDERDLLLVRQPRPAVGDPDALEIPAGKLDVPGEPPLDTARRELAEEIGFAAARWAPILAFHTSIGVLDEVVHLYHATELSPAHAVAEEDERIELVRWPLCDIAGALAATRDSKTLIGLMWLRERLAA